MIRDFAGFVGSMPDWSVINVVVDKCGKPPSCDAFEIAWRVLIQRFQNTLCRRNFPGPANPDDRGVLFCDHTDNAKVIQIMRQMRRSNPVPNQPAFGPGSRNLPLFSMVDDPNFRDSAHSYFIQTADLVAFLVYQKHAASRYMRKKAGHRYFERLRPVLCLHAGPGDPDGIVRL